MVNKEINGYSVTVTKGLIKIEGEWYKTSTLEEWLSIDDSVLLSEIMKIHEDLGAN